MAIDYERIAELLYSYALNNLSKSFSALSKAKSLFQSIEDETGYHPLLQDKIDRVSKFVLEAQQQGKGS